MEPVRKWGHFLTRNTFTLITDQRSISFMLDKKRRTKIKNNKVQKWHMELALFSYVIKYRSGQRNVGPDLFTRALCTVSALTLNTLQDLHKNLCHPGISRLLHFARTKNLPFSTTDVQRVTSQSKMCAKVKHTFCHWKQGTLIEATQPMEYLNIYFKGPLPASTRNKHLLIVVDEYSRFPFAFPCKDMTTNTVTQCLDQIFTLCEIHSF